MTHKRFPCLYEGCSNRFRTKIGRNNHFRDVHETSDSSSDEEFDYNMVRDLFIYLSKIVIGFSGQDPGSVPTIV